MKKNQIIVCVMAIFMAISFVFNTVAAVSSGGSAEALYQEGLKCLEKASASAFAPELNVNYKRGKKYIRQAL